MRLQIANCRVQIGAALIGCLLSAAPCRAEVMDRVLAVVAGELILLSDIRAAREFGFVTIERGGDQDAQALARLIDRALILAEVDRFAPPEPDSPAVDKGVATLRQRFSSAEAFAAALARVGIEERHLREYVRQDLRMAAYLEQRFTTIPPPEDEIERYYREHPDRLTRDGVLIPLEDARPAIVQALSAQGREALVGDWLAGLRRRADIRVATPTNRVIE
jgi:parvulin-like peptidyl-prolyl isomerase